MGFVYVIETKDGCKVGISEKCVEKRVMALQTGCPEKFRRVWCSRNIPDHLACEKIIHDHFKDKKTHGEWFEISFFEACEYADKICVNGPDKLRIKELEEENRKLINSADKLRIKELEEENRILKKQITEMFTADDLSRAIIRLMAYSQSERISC